MDSPVSLSPSTSHDFRHGEGCWPLANTSGPGLTTPSNSQLRFQAETPGGQTAQGMPRPPWKAAVSNSETEAIGSFHLSPGDQWYALGGMLMPIQPNPGNLATEAQLRQPPDFSNSTILALGQPLVKTQGHSNPRQHTSRHLSATPREILGHPWTPVWHSTFRGVSTAFSQMQPVCCWCRARLTDGWPLPNAQRQPTSKT